MKKLYIVVALILILYIIVDVSIKGILILLMVIYIIFRISKISGILSILLFFCLIGVWGLHQKNILLKKNDTFEAIEIIDKIISAELNYRKFYGKFYICSDFNKTIREIKMDSLSNMFFEYNMKIGETTILVRANKKGKTDYIYGFFPEENSYKIKGYNINTWDNRFSITGYMNNSNIEVDLKNDGNVTSTY